MIEIIGKINNCRTMQELDGLAIEVVQYGGANGQEKFLIVQKAFCRKKNSIKRDKLLTWEEKQIDMNIRAGNKK